MTQQYETTAQKISRLERENAELKRRKRKREADADADMVAMFMSGNVGHNMTAYATSEMIG